MKSLIKEYSDRIKDLEVDIIDINLQIQSAKKDMPQIAIFDLRARLQSMVSIQLTYRSVVRDLNGRLAEGV